MGTENKFLADVYSRLLLWIDTTTAEFARDDGGKGEHSTPDLCFYFDDTTYPKKKLKIEAKMVVQNKNEEYKITITNKQKESWGTDHGASPHLWIGKKKGVNVFYCWKHKDGNFKRAINEAKKKSGKSANYYFVTLNHRVLNPLTFSGLILEILNYASQEEFLRSSPGP